MDFHKKVKIAYQVYGEDGGAAFNFSDCNIADD